MARLRPRAHHSTRVWAGIAAAGAGASLLRYAITAEGGWGTIVVANVLGCAVLGGLVARGRATPILAAGFCGGLTTFSGVCAQALTAARGEPVGFLSASGGGGARLLLAALGLLALNALAGLLAFLATRRALGGADGRPGAASMQARP